MNVCCLIIFFFVYKTFDQVMNEFSEKQQFELFLATRENLHRWANNHWYMKFYILWSQHYQWNCYFKKKKMAWFMDQWIRSVNNLVRSPNPRTFYTTPWLILLWSEELIMIVSWGSKFKPSQVLSGSSYVIFWRENLFFLNHILMNRPNSWAQLFKRVIANTCTKSYFIFKILTEFSSQKSVRINHI